MPAMFLQAFSAYSTQGLYCDRFHWVFSGKKTPPLNKALMRLNSVVQSYVSNRCKLYIY